MAEPEQEFGEPSSGDLNRKHGSTSRLAEHAGLAAAGSSGQQESVSAIAGASVTGAAGASILPAAAGGVGLAAPGVSSNSNAAPAANPEPTSTTAAPPAATTRKPGQQRRILAMGPGDGGKTSMTRVCFENWEPARTQVQGKTSMAVREEIFLFGRRVFSFFDCGGQVSYFDGYLKDPYLFNDCAALVFVVDVTLFFLQQEDHSSNSETSETAVWSPQTIRDVFAKTVAVLHEKSPDARVFLLFNKMDKIPSSATANLTLEQIDAVLTESARKLQQATVDIFLHNKSGDGSATSGGDVESAGAAIAAAASGEKHLLATLDEQVPCFRTSIFSNSIVRAWSHILVQLLEPQSAVMALQSWLDRIRASSGGEIMEAGIIDSSTLICLAASSSFSPNNLASECGIRAKRQRLKGLEFVAINSPENYNMVWRPLLPNRLQLLLVGDGKLCSPGVTQLNAERIAEAFCSRFVEDSFPPPWPEDVVEVKQLLGLL